jgi:hypothetical protein
MPPHRRQSQKSAQPGGRADVDGERLGPASSTARKGTKGTSTRRPSDSNRRERRPKGEKAGRKRPAFDHQATARSGHQLPESRIIKPPETQLDFDERQETWATEDEAILNRHIRWHWHRTAQRLVTYVGPSAFALVIFVLTRELGLAPQTAVKLSLACLASATAGHFSREFLTTLSGKRRSRYRSEDDVSRNRDDGSF